LTAQSGIGVIGGEKKRALVGWASSLS